MKVMNEDEWLGDLVDYLQLSQKFYLSWRFANRPEKETKTPKHTWIRARSQ